MNDLVRGFRFEGHVHYRGKDVYADNIDPVAVRRHIGMVFQQPNPFAMSIFRNVAFGLRLNGYKGNVEEKVEKALRSAALWEEVKDKLKQSGLSLSGGQQQRLCIARAIATEPEVLLMDEPCSALDPVATRKIEELMMDLKQKYTIAIVTHNMQQAVRVADKTAFLYVDTTQGGRTGYLVEYGDTRQIFEDPREQPTKEYIAGAFSRAGSVSDRSSPARVQQGDKALPERGPSRAGPGPARPARPATAALPIPGSRPPAPSIPAPVARGSGRPPWPVRAAGSPGRQSEHHRGTADHCSF